MNEQIKEIARVLLDASRQNSKDTDICKGYTAFDSQTIFEFGCDRLNAATALYKNGYRKATDVAADILDDIIDALTSERIEEEKKANSALEAQDTMSYDIFSYAEDKLETILTALGIFKNLHLKKYESEGEK